MEAVKGKTVFDLIYLYIFENILDENPDIKRKLTLKEEILSKDVENLHHLVNKLLERKLFTYEQILDIHNYLIKFCDEDEAKEIISYNNDLSFTIWSLQVYYLNKNIIKSII